jgi:hypothetical protein
MLNVIMQNVVFLNVISLSVVMLNVVMLNVVMLNVMAPQTEVYLTIVNHNSTSVTTLIVQAIGFQVADHIGQLW